MKKICQWVIVASGFTCHFVSAQDPVQLQVTHPCGLRGSIESRIEHCRIENGIKSRVGRFQLIKSGKVKNREFYLDESSAHIWGPSFKGIDQGVTWQEALDFCRRLNKADDPIRKSYLGSMSEFTKIRWAAPNLKQLVTAGGNPGSEYDDEQFNRFLQVLPNLNKASIWSSTHMGKSAWYFSASGGDVYFDYQPNFKAVVCIGKLK